VGWGWPAPGDYPPRRGRGVGSFSSQGDFDATLTPLLIHLKSNPPSVMI
jgi:hypothetical protein